MAITAKYHGVLFIVAAPSTSIDLSLPSGATIPIEERSSKEVVTIRGVPVDQQQQQQQEQSSAEAHIPKKAKTSNTNSTTTTVHIAAKGIQVWNPSFDITPASLISAIATEKGMIVKSPGSEVFNVVEFLSTNKK